MRSRIGAWALPAAGVAGLVGLWGVSPHGIWGCRDGGIGTWEPDTPSSTFRTMKERFMEHEWVSITFNYAGWIECECGYRPYSQEDMDNHIPRDAS